MNTPALSVGFETLNASMDEVLALREAASAQNDTMQKAGAEYGSGPQHGVESSGAFTQMVPQDIDLYLTSETFKDDDLVVSQLLGDPIDVMNPLYESNTVEEYGHEFIDPFFGEASSPPLEQAKINRKVLQIKYLGVRRLITDVATVTGILGDGKVTKRALQQETDFGIQSLKQKTEVAYCEADTSLSPLHFKGLKQQMREGGSLVVDLQGGKLDLRELLRYTHAVSGQGRFGRTEVALVDPLMYGAMLDEATDHGRFTQPQTIEASGRNMGQLVLTPFGLTLIGGKGQMVLIKAAPYANRPSAPPTDETAKGESPPVISLANIITGQPQVEADSSSKFTALTAGTYRYKIIAHGDKGISAVMTTADVTVNAGDRVVFDWADAAIGLAAGNGSLRYFTVWRSERNKTTGYGLIKSFGRNDDGASNGTVFYDANTRPPGCVDVMGLDIGGRESIYLGQLLPTIRRPLANTETSQPFLIMSFKAPHIRHPKKQFFLTGADPTL